MSTHESRPGTTRVSDIFRDRAYNGPLDPEDMGEVAIRPEARTLAQRFAARVGDWAHRALEEQIAAEKAIHDQRRSEMIQQAKGVNEKAIRIIDALVDIPHQNETTQSSKVVYVVSGKGYIDRVATCNVSIGGANTDPRLEDNTIHLAGERPTLIIESSDGSQEVEVSAMSIKVGYSKKTGSVVSEININPQMYNPESANERDPSTSWYRLDIGPRGNLESLFTDGILTPDIDLPATNMLEVLGEVEQNATQTAELYKGIDEFTGM